MTRLIWDDYFLNLASTVAARATCPRASVGAVIVKDNVIISTGYNGSPSAVPHCLDVGCKMVNNHCKRAVHAEANAILYAKRDLTNATIYCTHQPCTDCTKLIIASKIIKIVYLKEYFDEIANLFRYEAGFEEFDDCNHGRPHDVAYPVARVLARGNSAEQSEALYSQRSVQLLLSRDLACSHGFVKYLTKPYKSSII